MDIYKDQAEKGYQREYLKLKQNEKEMRLTWIKGIAEIGRARGNEYHGK